MVRKLLLALGGIGPVSICSTGGTASVSMLYLLLGSTAPRALPLTVPMVNLISPKSATGSCFLSAVIELSVISARCAAAIAPLSLSVKVWPSVRSATVALISRLS